MTRKLARVPCVAHPHAAFAVRGRAIRTFGSQVFVLALSLAVLGLYLIVNEFQNPLSSQSLGLFTAAIVLATAMSLVIELTQLIRVSRHHASPRPPLLFLGTHFGVRAVHRSTGGTAPGLPESQGGRSPSTPRLPYHRCYVDHVRVRA